MAHRDVVCPTPKILLNGAEFRKIRNGQVVSVQLLDFDEMSEEDKSDFVKEVLEEFSVFKEEKGVRDVRVHNHNVKFGKLSFWAITKQVANRLKKRVQ